MRLGRATEEVVGAFNHGHDVHRGSSVPSVQSMAPYIPMDRDCNCHVPQHGPRPFAFLAFRIGTTRSAWRSMHIRPPTTDGRSIAKCRRRCGARARVAIPPRCVAGSTTRSPARSARITTSAASRCSSRRATRWPVHHLHGDAAARWRHADLCGGVRSCGVRGAAAQRDDGERPAPVGVHARQAGARAGRAPGQRRDGAHALPIRFHRAMGTRRLGVDRRDVRQLAGPRADPPRDGGPARDRWPAALAASFPARAARRRRGALLRRDRPDPPRGRALPVARGLRRRASRTSSARRSRRCAFTWRRCDSDASPPTRSARGRSTTSSAKRRGSATSSSACCASRAPAARPPIRARRWTFARSSSGSSTSSWPLADARGARIVAELEDVPTVALQPDALRHVVLNLLDNAVKYGPRGQTCG